MTAYEPPQPPTKLAYEPGRVGWLLQQLPLRLQVVAVYLAMDWTDREIADALRVDRQVIKRAKVVLRMHLAP